MLFGTALLLMPMRAMAAGCPVPQRTPSPEVLLESATQLRSLSRLLASGDDENHIAAIVHAIRSNHPAVKNAELVNYLVAGYCPVVMHLSGLSDAEKTSRIDRFTQRAARIVYRPAM